MSSSLWPFHLENDRNKRVGLGVEVAGQMAPVAGLVLSRFLQKGEQNMSPRFKFAKPCLVGLLVLAIGIGLAMALSPRPASGGESHDEIIAEGAGTTIIHGGTGAPAFVPVLTTVAFHAQRTGGHVTGSFDCLALAPEASTGSSSGQFTVNAMYVVGQITGATINGDTATLTGTSDITGLGAGSNVWFTFVVKKGGPGATAVLTVNTLPASPFNEVLVEGSIRVRGED